MRMEKIERDLMLLQRQISRSSGGSSGSTPITGNADFEVRLSAIEEQLRELSGRIEKTEFQTNKLSENLDRLQRDTDFRFGELSNSTPAPAATVAATSNSARADDSPKQRKIPDGNLAAGMDSDTKRENSGRPVGRTVDTTNNNQDSSISEDATFDDDIETDFSSPREHYNYAFRLLNQTQYDKAAASFAAFIKKYPKDPLVGNAYYWQGETFYIRREYVKAADSFRQGFEELPSGPKAPDNLLKLAMTLNSLKRDKEACVVLSQVVAKFKTTASAVSQKAQQEQKRIECK